MDHDDPDLQEDFCLIHSRTKLRRQVKTPSNQTASNDTRLNYQILDFQGHEGGQSG